MIKSIAFTFGRFSVPHKGHERLFDTLKDKFDDHVVFMSRTQDAKKNPLDFSTKLKYAKEIFPGVNFLNISTVNNPFDAIKYLVSWGYNDISMVVGSDRVDVLDRIQLYVNNSESNDPIYVDNFSRYSVLRDDSDGVEGLSSTKVREHILNNDIDSFKKCVPDTIGSIKKLQLFQEIKSKLSSN